MIRLFRVSLPASVVGLLLTEILLAFGCYVAAFLLITEEDLQLNYLYEGGLERNIVVAASIILGVYFNDLYSDLRVMSRLRVVQQYCLVLGMAFLVQALLSYLYPELILGRWQMMVGSAMALVLLPAWRMMFDVLVFRILNRQKVMFVGANRQVELITSSLLEKPQFAMTSCGYLACHEMEDPFPGLGPWLGRMNEVKEIYQRERPDLVVVGLKERRGQMPVHELMQLRLSGVRVEDASTLYEKVMWRVSVESLRPSQLLFSAELGPNPRNLTLQKVYSLLLALIGTVITLPLMIVVWLAVRLTSPGPGLYRQSRVGMNGRVFEVLKFRSMYIDAEARTGAVWAQKNDPRITPVGRWIRKLRLDELPQFLNVLKGDMAIVGPRPERPEFVSVLSEQIPFYGQRHTILPGITGWAQINHKYGDTLEDTITKLEYDLYYLKNLSFSLDMYIIFHTVKVMLLSRGSQ